MIEDPLIILVIEKIQESNLKLDYRQKKLEIKY